MLFWQTAKFSTKKWNYFACRRQSIMNFAILVFRSQVFAISSVSCDNWILISCLPVGSQALVTSEEIAGGLPYNGERLLQLFFIDFTIWRDDLVIVLTYPEHEKDQHECNKETMAVETLPCHVHFRRRLIVRLILPQKWCFDSVMVWTVLYDYGVTNRLVCFPFK